MPQELFTAQARTISRYAQMCAQVAARAELDVDLHACAPSLLEREEAAILLQQKLTKVIRPRTPCPHSCSAACMRARAEPKSWIALPCVR